MNEISRDGCRRCGTCCQKGGPSFHEEDRHLIAEGIIPVRHLFTIRQGEPAWDNIEGIVLPTATDRIKIKGTGGTWSCIYYDDARKGCRIYENRPVECRTLACWDTAGIESLYRTALLTREDLISGVDGLWDLVADHQVRCSYDEVRRLLAGVKDGDAASADALQKMARYDLHLRRLTVEKGRVGPDMTDFLFGRALVDTLKPMGVRLVCSGEHLKLDPSGAAGS